MAKVKRRRKGAATGVVAMGITKHVRPISGEIIGYRVVVANCNKARWCLKEEAYVQSFHPTYRISESSDYTTEEQAEAAYAAWAKVWGQKYRINHYA